MGKQDQRWNDGRSAFVVACAMAAVVIVAVLVSFAHAAEMAGR